MRTSSQTGVEGPGCFKYVQATWEINPLASFLLFKTVSMIVAPLWSQALQIHSIPSIPKTEHHIFALLPSFSFASSAFSLYHVHLLGVALGLALCFFLIERHLSCFQVVVIVNKAAIHTCMQFSCEYKLSAYLDTYLIPRTEIAEYCN